MSQMGVLRGVCKKVCFGVFFVVFRVFWNSIENVAIWTCFARCLRVSYENEKKLNRDVIVKKKQIQTSRNYPFR